MTDPSRPEPPRDEPPAEERMTKTVTVKEDGRMLIYYAFAADE